MTEAVGGGDDGGRARRWVPWKVQPLVLPLLLVLLLCCSAPASCQRTVYPMFNFTSGAVVGRRGDCGGFLDIDNGYNFFATYMQTQYGRSNNLLQIRDRAGKVFNTSLQYIGLDDGCNITTHYELVTDLLTQQNPVQVLFGAGSNFAINNSLIANSVPFYGQPNGAIAFQCCVAPDALYQMGLQNVYGMYVSNTRYTDVVLKSMAFAGVRALFVAYRYDQVGARTTCLAALEYADLVQQLQPNFNISGVFSYSGDDSTSLPFLQNVVQQSVDLKSDAILICDTQGGGNLYAKIIQQSGHYYKAKWIMLAPAFNDFLSIDQMTPRTNNAARYVMTAVQWHPRMLYVDPYFGTASAFSRAYQAQYGSEPSYLAAGAAATAYTWMLAISLAFRDCIIQPNAITGGTNTLLFDPTAVQCNDAAGRPYNSTGYQQVQFALQRLNNDTFFGPVEFNQQRRNIGIRPATTQVVYYRKKWSIECVLPIDLANAALVLPISPPEKHNLSGYSLVITVVLAVLAGLAAMIVLIIVRTRKPAAVQAIINMTKRLKGEPTGGAVSLVVTDIEGYSEMMKETPELMAAAITLHNKAMATAQWTNFGYVVEQEGDSFTMVFYDAMDAVTFCLQVQQLLMLTRWPEGLVATDGKAAKKKRPVSGIKLSVRRLGVNITTAMRTAIASRRITGKMLSSRMSGMTGSRSSAGVLSGGSRNSVGSAAGIRSGEDGNGMGDEGGNTTDNDRNSGLGSTWNSAGMAGMFGSRGPVTAASGGSSMFSYGQSTPPGSSATLGGKSEQSALAGGFSGSSAMRRPKVGSLHSLLTNSQKVLRFARAFPSKSASARLMAATTAGGDGSVLDPGSIALTHQDPASQRASTEEQLRAAQASDPLSSGTPRSRPPSPLPGGGSSGGSSHVGSGNGRASPTAAYAEAAGGSGSMAASNGGSGNGPLAFGGSSSAGSNPAYLRSTSMRPRLASTVEGTGGSGSMEGDAPSLVDGPPNVAAAAAATKTSSRPPPRRTKSYHSGNPQPPPPVRTTAQTGESAITAGGTGSSSPLPPSSSPVPPAPSERSLFGGGFPFSMFDHLRHGSDTSSLPSGGPGSATGSDARSYTRANKSFFASNLRNGLPGLDPTEVMEGPDMPAPASMCETVATVGPDGERLPPQLSETTLGALPSILTQETEDDDRPALFHGLRVRMGVASGDLPPNSGANGSTLMARTKVVCDAANGGQVLMCGETFRQIKPRLEELGAIDQHGLSHALLKAQRIPVWQFWRRHEAHAPGAVLLAMGEYTQAPAVVPSLVGAESGTAFLAGDNAQVSGANASGPNVLATASGISQSASATALNTIAPSRLGGGAGGPAPNSPSRHAAGGALKDGTLSVLQRSASGDPLPSARGGAGRRPKVAKHTAFGGATLISTAAGPVLLQPASMSMPGNSALAAAGGSNSSAAHNSGGNLSLAALAGGGSQGGGLGGGHKHSRSADLGSGAAAAASAPTTPSGSLGTITGAINSSSPSNTLRASGTTPFAGVAVSETDHSDFSGANGSGPAQAQAYINSCKDMLRLFQVLSPHLANRAYSFGSKLSLKKEQWQMQHPPYFCAPGTFQSPLIPDESIPRLPLPPVTMVFCCVEGAKQLASNHRRTLGATHRLCLLIIQQTLIKYVDDGYLCRDQPGELKYMAVFKTPTAALEWCCVLQRALLGVEWPPLLAKQEHFKEVRDAHGTLLFSGPRMKMGVCQGVPNTIVPDHVGRADYHGPSINQAARYMDAAAHGGQVVCELSLAQEVFALWRREGEASEAGLSGNSNGRMPSSLRLRNNSSAVSLAAIAAADAAALEVRGERDGGGSSAVASAFNNPPAHVASSSSFNGFGWFGGERSGGSPRKAAAAAAARRTAAPLATAASADDGDVVVEGFPSQSGLGGSLGTGTGSGAITTTPFAAAARGEPLASSGSLNSLDGTVLPLTGRGGRQGGSGLQPSRLASSGGSAAPTVPPTPSLGPWSRNQPNTAPGYANSTSMNGQEVGSLSLHTFGSGGLRHQTSANGGGGYFGGASGALAGSSMASFAADGPGGMRGPSPSHFSFNGASSAIAGALAGLVRGNRSNMQSAGGGADRDARRKSLQQQPPPAAASAGRAIGTGLGGYPLHSTSNANSSLAHGAGILMGGPAGTSGGSGNFNGGNTRGLGSFGGGYDSSSLLNFQHQTHVGLELEPLDEGMSVDAIDLGCFQFKGNPEALRMVHIACGGLQARTFPYDPPKGKGQRVSPPVATLPLDSVMHTLPDMVLQVRNAHRIGILERQVSLGGRHVAGGSGTGGLLGTFFRGKSRRWGGSHATGSASHGATSTASTLPLMETPDMSVTDVETGSHARSGVAGAGSGGPPAAIYNTAPVGGGSGGGFMYATGSAFNSAGQEELSLGPMHKNR